LNTNITRRGTELILEQERTDGRSVQIVTVGRRGQDFLVRRGRNLMATFTGIVDRVSYDDIIPIARVITDRYIEGTIDRAVLVYPRFISAKKREQEATSKRKPLKS